MNTYEIVDLDLVPAPPGNPQILTVGNGTNVGLSLENETRYCFALRSIDGENNASEWSNTAAETSPVVPPGVITNLSCDFVLVNAEIDCTFTGTGNDGSAGGAPLGYRVHVYASDGNTRTFDIVDNIQGPGVQESLSFPIVSEGLTHSVEIQAFDQASFGERSGAVEVDVPAISPSPIEDLICNIGEVMDERPVVCTFTETGDDAEEGCLTDILVYTWVGSAELPTNCNNPQTCIAETIEASETCGGTPRSIDLNRFDEGSVQHVALVARDDDPTSENPESNKATITIPLIAPGDFELNCDADPALAPRVDCSFVEPGDDGDSGSVTSYQIRTPERRSPKRPFPPPPSSIPPWYPKAQVHHRASPSIQTMDNRIPSQSELPTTEDRPA